MNEERNLGSEKLALFAIGSSVSPELDLASFWVQRDDYFALIVVIIFA